MFSDTYRCRPCGHEFTHDHKGFWLGPLPAKLDRDTSEAFLAEHTQIQYCPTCQLGLIIPTHLDRAEWLDWRARNAPDFGRYPFLVSLAARIDASFTGEPWSVDIGSISCPYCATLLVTGSFQPVCRQCGSSDLEHINQWHSQTRDVWPPII